VLDPLEPVTVLGILLAAQGLVGSVQYELKLPGEMVWVHVGLATVTWLVTLWAVATEGRIGKSIENPETLDTIEVQWQQSAQVSLPQ
jgi:cytochrome c oxidase assembly protein subunit 15